MREPATESRINEWLEDENHSLIVGGSFDERSGIRPEHRARLSRLDIKRKARDFQRRMKRIEKQEQ